MVLIISNQPKIENFSDEYFISLAIKEAEKAKKYGDIPVGALIVRDNIIISKAHNQIERYGNPLLHAEIIAIQSAAKKIEYKHLYECVLYVNLEPCVMCSGAIILSRLKKVVFGASDSKTGGIQSLYQIGNDSRLNHQIEVTSGIMQNECSIQIKNFFQELRINKKK